MVSEWVLVEDCPVVWGRPTTTTSHHVLTMVHAVNFADEKVMTA